MIDILLHNCYIHGVPGTSTLSLEDIPLDISLADIEVRLRFIKAYSTEQYLVKTVKAEDILAMVGQSQDVYFQNVSFTRSDDHMK